MKEMTLGQKIKEARLSKKMTQNELVGDFITRNMLSKIENDSATPSVRTLEFLAQKLEMPVSYFMTSLFETLHYTDTSIGEGVQKSNLLVKMQENFNAPDEFLKISEDFSELLKDPSEDDRYFYLLIEFYIENGMFPHAEKYLEMMQHKEEILGIRQANTLYLKGLYLMKTGNYQDAQQYLISASELNHSAILAEKIFFSLENCALACNDYKNAYYYSNLRRTGTV